MKSKILHLLGALLRLTVTLVAVFYATKGARMLWHHYRTSPWTRDGRVIAETVHIAPEVAGTVVELKVLDNQFVHKGDVLFSIDRARYELVLRQAEAALESSKSELALKRTEAERNRLLRASGTVSVKEKQFADVDLSVAEAAVLSATAAVDTAKLNLDRSIVASPVNGYVTNLRLHTGDYAAAGQEILALIDADSFWVAGYFEETKLPAIHVGDRARIDLMGGTQPLYGLVESRSRGIADATLGNGKELASVNPVFNWVRLAQRIPVRIRFESLPPDTFLSSGMTCTVTVQSPSQHLLSRL